MGQIMADVLSGLRLKLAQQSSFAAEPVKMAPKSRNK
jgi:hypothetical protein